MPKGKYPAYEKPDPKEIGKVKFTLVVEIEGKDYYPYYATAEASDEPIIAYTQSKISAKLTAEDYQKLAALKSKGQLPPEGAVLRQYEYKNTEATVYSTECPSRFDQVWPEKKIIIPVAAAVQQPEAQQPAQQTIKQPDKASVSQTPQPVKSVTVTEQKPVVAAAVKVESKVEPKPAEAVVAEPVVPTVVAQSAQQPADKPKEKPVVIHAAVTPVQTPQTVASAATTAPSSPKQQTPATPVQPVQPVIAEPKVEPAVVQMPSTVATTPSVLEPVKLEEKPKPQEEIVTLHVASTPTITPSTPHTPAKQSIVKGFKESARDDAAPKSHLGEHEAPILSGKPVLPPKPVAKSNQQPSPKSKPVAKVEIPTVTIPDEQLKEAIKKQVVSFLHSTPNHKELTMIRYLAQQIQTEVLGYKALTPKSMQTMIKNLIKDFNASQIGTISKDAIEEAKKVIVFDSVWKAVDLSFNVHKNDYDELRRHVDKIEEWEKGNLVEFINSFKGTVGGNNKINRSQLFTKDFDEAMKLHVSDPASSKALLEALKGDKSYDPAKLSKAYVSCMKDIQDYRTSLTTKAEKATGEDMIKTFISEASKAIKAQVITDKSLSELRDKLIPNTEFLSSTKMKPAEFTKEFSKQFPTLYTVFTSMMDEKSGAKEMQKLVRDITNKLKVDDKKHPDADPYVRVHKMLSELELQTQAVKADKQRGESVKNFLSFMNIEKPKAAKEAQEVARR